MLSIVDLCRTGLQPVSFQVDKGECVAIRGPSGAGKTLLLRAIADLDPNEGDVTLFGEARSKIPAPQWRRRVGYLPAEPGWWAETVGEHFADWGKAKELAGRLGLPEDADRWPLTRPSTGERQRLALVRALAADPQVLMMDEPTAALDPASVAAVEAVMTERLAAGLIVLWVSHDRSQSERMARRILHMEQGRLTEEAPAS